MASKRAFESWYFEYYEAEREFLDAKRSFELKKRDIRLFLFSAYSEWCKQRFGHVLRPQYPVEGCDNEKSVDLFYTDFKVSPLFRAMATQLLNEAFNEEFQQICGSE